MKKLGSNICKTFSMLISLFLFAFFSMSIKAMDTLNNEEKTIIKIGYIDYEGFIEKTVDGYRGYGIELLNEIASRTNWEYEFHYDNFSNILTKIEKGELDFFCHAQKTSEREKKFLFSKYSTGSESSVLYTKTTDERFYYNDYQAFNNINIAFLEGSFQNNEFYEYSALHSFSYNAKYYKTQHECFEALNASEVDAVAMGSLGGINGYKVISLYGSDPFYFMSGKQNQELVTELDTILAEIFAQNPTYSSSLYQKHYGNRDTLNKILITREEAEYISSSEEIVVGLMQNRSPLSYLDENNVPKGMIVDLMNLVSEKSGLTFKYKFLDVAETGYNFLTNKKGKLVAGVASSVFSFPSPFLIQSDTLQESSVVFVGKEGTTFSPNAELTVALPSGFINGEAVVSSLYPNFKFYKTSNNEECLKAIKNGKADVMLQNIYIILECLQSPIFEELQVFPAYDFEEDEKVLSLPEDALLMSIVNKAINTITSDEQNDVVIANTIAKTHHTSFLEIIYKYRISFIGIVALIGLIIFMLFAIITIRHKNYMSMESVNKKLTLSNNQLEEAVLQADSANRAKSRFLSNMSHDIRTPMNAIIGMTHIASEEINEDAPDMDTLKDSIRTIELSGNHLLTLINDILDISKIESGHISLAKNKLSITELVDKMVEIIEPLKKEKDINLRVYLKVTHEEIYGDELRINQIFANILTNAIKYTNPLGNIRLELREEKVNDDPSKLRYVYIVEDDGIGMEPKFLENLFDRFTRAVDTRINAIEGTGIGMAITKQLVDLMGGTIDVTSQINQGSKFTVTIEFPFAKEEISHITRKCNVLMIDDNYQLSEMFKTYFEEEGCVFDFLTSIKPSFDLIEKRIKENIKYDIIFVDWNEYKKNSSIEFSEFKNRLEKNCKIIILGYHISMEKFSFLHDEGFTKSLYKPLYRSKVFSLINTLLDGSEISQVSKKRTFDMKVLVAEDNNVNWKVIARVLMKYNINADRAINGKNALEIIKDTSLQYDLILMDIQMPIMNGYEATQEIRNLSDQKKAHIPIYAMTADTFAEDVSLCIEKGMNGHLAKPIEIDKLLKVLSEVEKAKEEK